jgi:hypothetical protein
VLEWPRWECHRYYFGTLAIKFEDSVRQFATSREDMTTLLLSNIPPSHYGAIYLTRNGISSQLWPCPPSSFFNLQFMFRTPQMFCSAIWAMLLALLREWADAWTGIMHIFHGQYRKCIHSCLHVFSKVFGWLTHWPQSGVR